MRLTVSRKKAKKIKSLGVKIDKFWPLVVKKLTVKNMSGGNNGKVLTVSRKLVKIFNR